MFLMARYINKLLIFFLIILSFYNILSISILLFNNKISGHLFKSFNYLPYKHSIFFNNPLRYSMISLSKDKVKNKLFYNILKTTQKRSALDYSYWKAKLYYQIENQDDLKNFEKNFQNAYILSKNNLSQKKIFKLFYLRNIPSFSIETKNIILKN